MAKIADVLVIVIIGVAFSVFIGLSVHREFSKWERNDRGEIKCTRVEPQE